MYLMFAGHKYYPEGGSSDFRGKFKTIKDAKQYFRDNKETISGNSYPDVWADIVNYKTIESVLFGTINEENKINPLGEKINPLGEKWWKRRGKKWIELGETAVKQAKPNARI